MCIHQEKDVLCVWLFLHVRSVFADVVLEESEPTSKVYKIYHTSNVVKTVLRRLAKPRCPLVVVCVRSMFETSIVRTHVGELHETYLFKRF